MNRTNPQDAALARLFEGLAQLREIKLRQRPARASDIDVTVAVMSYNNARFVGQTIESVLAQEGVRLELKVFDDCSPDDSVSVLERYLDDPRFSYRINARNLGMIDNYNQCLQAGTGRYVVVLGSDDVLYPGHLRSLVQAMDQHTEVALGYTQCLWIDEHDQVLAHAVHPGHRDSNYVGGRDELIDLLTYDSYITPSAAIFRRSALPRFALEDGRIHRQEMLAGDWELWTRIAQAAPQFLFLNQASVGYRIHGGQISKAFYSSEKPLSEHTRILELNLAIPDARRRMQHGAAGIWQLYLNRLAGYPQEVQERFAPRKDAIRQALFEAPSLDGDSSVQFSVILTTFNRPRLLADALDSLAQQTCQDFEVILINDKGSPVEALLDGYTFPITYVRQGRNQGPAAARNAGHRLARGRYVVYLDDDDLYLPHHLQILAQGAAQYPGEIIYTDALLVTETLEDDRRVELRREQRYQHDAFSREWLFYNNYIPVNTFACPRELILAIGGFDEHLPAFEDWDLLMRLALRADLRHIPGDTVQARMRASDTDPNRRSQQAFKDYPALYQQLYTRHGDLGSDVVRDGRRKMLVRLGVLEQDYPDAPQVQEWLAQRQLTPVQRGLVDQHLQAHQQGPCFTLLVLDLLGDTTRLAATQASISRLAYANVQVVLLTVQPTDARSLFGDVTEVTTQNWITVLNQVLAYRTFDWFCLLEAGDELTPTGLLIAGLELLGAPECRALYGDGLYRQTDGQMGAVLRPDFNLDYLLSLPASMARHWLLRRGAVIEAGGFDPHLAQCPQLAVILRLIDNGGLEGLGHIAEPLLISDAPQLADLPDERDAILAHLRNRGYTDPQVLQDKPGQYRLRYGQMQHAQVSILILAGSDLNYLRRCVESLLQHIRHSHYEVLLIEDDPAADEVHAWLEALADLGEARLRPVMHAAAHICQAQAVNAAAAQASGDYLLLLAPRAAAFDDRWLDELLNHAQRPEVAAVGAKLLAADGKVVHAGVILGLQGVAGRPFTGLPGDAPGYMQRLLVDQNYSAVSGDCLMIRREVFESLGGLDERIPARYQDIDLCLRARQLGYLNVWSAWAQLLISEPAQQPALPEEEEAVYARWLPVLARDTAYNPNLSLVNKGGFQLASSALSWRPLSSFKPLPCVLAHPVDLSWSGQCRVVQPWRALERAGQLDGTVTSGLLHLPDLERYAPDSIVFHRRIDEQRLHAMGRVSRLTQAFKVLDLDLYLPAMSATAEQPFTLHGDTHASLRQALACVDRVVVPTASLGQTLSSLHSDVRVIESRLPRSPWSELQGGRRNEAKPRVGLVITALDTADVLMLTDVIRSLAEEVHWVAMGACPAPLRALFPERYDLPDVTRYPAALAALDLDLALVAREQTWFNAHRDHLALLEHGACGVAVICSDVEGLRETSLPVARVANNSADWLSAIRMHLSEREATRRLGEQLQAGVRERWLLDDQHLATWRQVWLPG